MKFVDLFAGLGGFHLALTKFNHRCVFACEIDAMLRELYKTNFGIEPAGDIRQIQLDLVPEHDILCAGFPCQPFSKAGFQQGFLDESGRGDLIDIVLDIVELRHPQYIILENVPEFLHHQDGMWWRWTEGQLKSLGYGADHRRLSPHKFGIPQVRDRLFIVAALGGLGEFQWPVETNDEPRLQDYLDTEPSNAKPLNDRVKECLKVWQDFLNRFPASKELPSYPIWTMEFGADYEFETSTPFARGVEDLKRTNTKGAFGRVLADLDDAQVMNALPSYARTKELQFPKWKRDFIRQNRQFYQTHRCWIDAWLPQVLKYPASWQKFEWNCKGEKRDLFHLVIQFRASGVRVKRATTSPSLIAMTDTQVPIIPWENRYLTPRECAKLQSLGDLASLPASRTKAFQALGNAVNAQIVELIAAQLLTDQPKVGLTAEYPRLRNRVAFPGSLASKAIQLPLHSA